MFHSIATHYVGAHARHERQIEEAQEEVLRAVDELAGDLCDLAVTDASEVYLVQRAIEKEETVIRSELERFVSQGRRWAQEVGKLDAALRELGDVENMVQVMDEQIRNFVGTLGSKVQDQVMEEAPQDQRGSVE